MDFTAKFQNLTLIEGYYIRKIEKKKINVSDKNFKKYRNYG